MSNEATCAHEACRCTKPYSAQTRAASTRPLDPDAEFCSDRCARQARQAQGVRGDGCECGHPECTPQATADIPPMM